MAALGPCSAIGGDSGVSLQRGRLRALERFSYNLALWWIIVYIFSHLPFLLFGFSWVDMRCLPIAMCSYWRLRHLWRPLAVALFGKLNCCKNALDKKTKNISQQNPRCQKVCVNSK